MNGQRILKQLLNLTCALARVSLPGPESQSDPDPCKVDTRSAYRSTSLPAVSLLIALVLCASIGRLHAESVLHSFGDGSVANDGHFPHAALVLGSDGNFYGTTTEGGSTVSSETTGLGTAFKVAPSGAVTILHSFGDGSTANDGEYPEAALIQGSDGNFYGTTNGGGSDDVGAVFKMTPSGTVTTLHSFGDGSVANDGKYPEAALVQGLDGNFYGITYAGGSMDGGAVFKMTPSGAMTILHSFDDGSVANDGAYPYSALIQGSDGNFYGTTFLGGSDGGGTAFKMTPSGAVTILHSFLDGSVTNDGANPYAGLIQGSDG
ncbi:MAG: choice-of-anchor tandem repeat GloVer-containing protein, partial [Capsulimonadaceae bacterium]